MVRFLISGSTATAVHLSLFIVGTEWFSLWYLYATSIGFLGGVTTSFLLQKYWTFRDTSSHILIQQSVGYVSLATFNLYLNGLIMFVLVEHWGMLPVLAQIVSSASIASESFLISSLLFGKAVRYRMHGEESH